MRSGLLAALVLASCSGKATPPEPAPAQKEQAQGACLPTVAQANGAKCSAEGLECRVPFACDAVNEQATCTCAGGAFSCADRLGAIPLGAEPACTPRGPSDETPCAPTMAAADGTPCETTGKLCAYEGPVCPESLTGEPALESCVCRGATNGTKHFVCYPIKCLGT